MEMCSCFRRPDPVGYVCTKYRITEFPIDYRCFAQVEKRRWFTATCETQPGLDQELSLSRRQQVVTFDSILNLNGRGIERCLFIHIRPLLCQNTQKHDSPAPEANLSSLGCRDQKLLPLEKFWRSRAAESHDPLLLQILQIHAKISLKWSSKMSGGTANLQTCTDHSDRVYMDVFLPSFGLPFSLFFLKRQYFTESFL